MNTNTNTNYNIKKFAKYQTFARVKNIEKTLEYWRKLTFIYFQNINNSKILTESRNNDHVSQYWQNVIIINKSQDIY